MARSKNIEQRQSILSKALQMFYERGVDAVMMKEIAKESGISVSLLNHYFPRKEEILVQIFYNMIHTVLGFAKENVTVCAKETDNPGILMVSAFYYLFYDILLRDNKRLLMIYTVVLYNAPLLQRATDRTFKMGEEFPELPLSNEGKFGLYTVNGAMSQIVSLFLSIHETLDFDLIEQLRNQLRLFYFSMEMTNEQVQCAEKFLTEILSQEMYDRCYQNYLDKMYTFEVVD